ncbi:hypothetical protein JCM10914_6227 [Paenibacillus sp. JCM 10914]|nr:hypothetical protein JCM10914_6227 [Paenibacillus sp. JCM 10914]
MVHKWKRWNTAARKWLWILVVLGVAAALPVGYDRLQTESTSKHVEMVFDYRDLLDVAVYQSRPEDFVSEQLDRLKEAGVISMALYESTLDELVKSRRIAVYDGQQAADLTGTTISPNENFTYIAFLNEASASTIKPVIEETFTRIGIPIRPWSTDRAVDGLILETPRSNAVIKPMLSDPLTIEMLKGKGFNIVPRLSDSLPYNAAYMEYVMGYFAEHDVRWILFDGDSARGFSDQAEEKSSIILPGC